jgi:hypothetical protein
VTEQVTPPYPPQPAAPSQVAAPPQPTPPAKAPSKAGGFVKRVVTSLVVAAVVGLAGLAWKYISGAPETAEVGSCLTGQSADALKTVDCGEPTAEHKVVGKLDGWSEADFEASDNPCPAFPTAENFYWEGKKGGVGYVLCLEPIAK